MYDLCLNFYCIDIILMVVFKLRKYYLVIQICRCSVFLTTQKPYFMQVINQTTKKWWEKMFSSESIIVIFIAIPRVNDPKDFQFASKKYTFEYCINVNRYVEFTNTLFLVNKPVKCNFLVNL